jgi:hypothetical protein
MQSTDTEALTRPALNIRRSSNRSATRVERSLQRRRRPVRAAGGLGIPAVLYKRGEI